jgi:hypothetical protein
MSNIYLEGWEAASLQVADLAQNGTISSGGFYAGSDYKLQYGGNEHRSSFKDGATPSEIYMGFRWMYDYTLQAGRLLIMRDSLGGTQFDVLLTAGGTLQVRRGGSTVLVTTSQTFSRALSYFIEIRYKVNSSTGVCELRADEGTAVTFSGNTLQTSTVDVASIAWFGDASPNYVDDAYINDTTGGVNDGWWGDVLVTGLVPNAAGDSTQLSIGGSSPPASNYQAVDELGPNDGTDYVYDTVVDDTDLYALPNLPSNLTNPLAVIIEARAQKSDADAAKIALPTKTGAGQSDGSDISLSSSWAYYKRYLDKDAADSAAWTDTKINALQVGVKVR